MVLKTLASGRSGRGWMLTSIALLCLQPQLNGRAEPVSLTCRWELLPSQAEASPEQSLQDIWEAEAHRHPWAFPRFYRLKQAVGGAGVHGEGKQTPPFTGRSFHRGGPFRSTRVLSLLIYYRGPWDAHEAPGKEVWHLLKSSIMLTRSSDVTLAKGV